MSAPRPVVFWGAAGHARVLRELVEACGMRLAALFDNAYIPSLFSDVPQYRGQEGFLRWREHANGDYAGTHE